MSMPASTQTSGDDPDGDGYIMANPPVTKTAIGLIGVEVTVVDAKARRELGYVGRVSIDAGLAEMTV